MEVFLGAHNLTKEEDSRQSFDVVNSVIYESYNTEAPNPAYLHDIAILTLDRTPILNKFVSYAPLSTSTDWNEKNGTKATVIGWGLTSNNKFSSSDVLLETNVTIKSAQDCIDKRYRYRAPKESFICTKIAVEDSCEVSFRLSTKHLFTLKMNHRQNHIFQGDSGGPLNCPIKPDGKDSNDFVVCGVVSFGKQGGCGSTTGKTYPIYTNVAFYRDWIAKNTGENL